MSRLLSVPASEVKVLAHRGKFLKLAVLALKTKKPLTFPDI